MVPVIAALVILVAGCGNDGTSDEVTVESKPYVDALVTDLETHGAGNIDLTGIQARCLAPRWVNVLQPERLEEANIDPEDLEEDTGFDTKAGKVPLSDAEIDKLVDAFGECDVDLQQAFIDHATSGATLSPEDRDCLDDALSDDFLHRMMGIELTKGPTAVDDDPTLSAELFEALSACPGAIDLGG
jgi:hypothetical protein